MSESIASIHLCASQSTPPFYHLSDNLFTFPDSLAPLVLPADPVDIMDSETRKVTGQENSAFVCCMDAFICVFHGFGYVHLHLYKCVYIAMSA